MYCQTGSVVDQEWAWTCAIGKVRVGHSVSEGCYKTENAAKRACKIWFKRHTDYEPEFE